MKKLLLSFLFFISFSSIYAITITQSGFFTLGGDITESGQVITISVSNITVDLGGYVVSGGTNGIVVNAGLSNVVIRNGRINNNTQGITIGAGCSDITLQNLEITNCTNSALAVNGTALSPVNRLSLENIVAELCVLGAVVSENIMVFTFVNNFLMQNSTVASNGTTSATTLTLVNFNNCNRGTIDNVSLVFNTADNLLGFLIDTTANFSFTNCEARSNTALSNLVGFRFTGGANNNNNTCQNCIASNNASSVGPMVGFELLALVTRNILRNCSAENNTTASAAGTANCIGFSLDQPTFCTLSGCTANYNRATAAGAHFAAGFNIGTSGVGTTGTKNCAFYNNTATANNDAGGNASSFGFRVISGGVGSANSGGSGNANCIFMGNAGILNGPTVPVTNTQQISSGIGGLVAASLLDKSSTNFTTVTSYTPGLINLRILS
jgi:hypothetical protein